MPKELVCAWCVQGKPRLSCLPWCCSPRWAGGCVISVPLGARVGTGLCGEGRLEAAAPGAYGREGEEVRPRGLLQNPGLAQRGPGLPGGRVGCSCCHSELARGWVRTLPQPPKWPLCWARCPPRH